MWLECPDEENHKCLFFEARQIASKLTGISETKIEETKHFSWDYEEYNDAFHGRLDPVDLTEVYEPVYYAD